MTDPVAIWHAEHMRFARLLDCLEQELTAFHGGEDPDYELMRDIVHYLHHYADHYHHPREDVAFGRMVKRDAALGLLALSLQQEHRVMAAVGETLLKYLEDILEDIVIERAVVEAAAATYLVYYRHHLAVEEKEMLPRATGLLTPEDWAAVAAAVAPGPDPVFGENVADRYHELHKRMMARA